MQDDPINPAQELEPLVYELDEFCRTHKLGKTMFYHLLHEGDGPDVFWLGRSPRITREAARDWREKMRARGRTQAAARVARTGTKAG
jgi:hypothetical protein